VKPLHLAETSPTFAHYEHLACVQREAARRERLPNVRRLLEESAERLEHLAREYEVTPVPRSLRLVPNARFASGALHVGPLALDIEGKSLAAGGSPVPVTGAEFAVLELLARSETVVKKTAIHAQLHTGTKADIRVIDVLVCKLRKKLVASCPSKTFIETVRGVGYCLVRPAETCKAAERGSEHQPLIARARVGARPISAVRRGTASKPMFKLTQFCPVL
jgi:DNA-binding winged helix-turn-helix (wHTH) protein